MDQHEAIVMPRVLGRLLSDVELIAFWNAHSCVRAIDLDPDIRRSREAYGVNEDPDSVQRQRVREQALHRGRLLALRLERVERTHQREGAVIRFLVNHGGASRFTSHMTGLYELVGVAFVAPNVLAAWKRNKDVRVPATRHGMTLLAASAKAWVEKPSQSSHSILDLQTDRGHTAPECP